MSGKELWVEKYRPKTIDGYVFRDENQKNQVQKWIDEKSIPMLLFSGPAGCGKTTLAKILINAVGVDDCDLLEINASRDNSIDNIRAKITGFVETYPFGEFKVVLFDEADYLSAAAQSALRNLIEQNHETARFIFTCNYPNRIIPAIHSRCQGFHFDKLDKDAFILRIAEILAEEEINADLDTLDNYVKSTYPDLRKCLNLIQMNSINSELIAPSNNDNSINDYMFKVIELIKNKKYLEARQLLCATVRSNEMEEIFTWMYNNLDLWSDDQDKQDKAIILIRNALVNHSMVADPEINLAACMVELSQIGE